MAKKNENHEPLIRISKRTEVSLKSNILVRAIAIIAALLVCGIITKIFTGADPIAIGKSFVHGAFGTGRLIVTIHEIAILLCVSLAVTPAFKMRFWNIGAEGQVLIGGLATAACMILLGDKVPNALLIIIMIAASMIAGAIWAVIPAVFKAKFDTNETLFTLMMNYVGIQLVSYFVTV